MSELRDVLSHSKNYFTANIATKALAVISLPVLTLVLSPSDYGVYQVFISYVGLLSIILSLNFNGSIARYYYEKTDDFGEFLSASLIGSIFILTIFVVPAIFNLNVVSSWLALPAPLVVFLIVSIVAKLFFSSYSHVNIAKSNSAKLAKITIIKSYSTFFIGICLVLLMADEQYMGLVYADIAIGCLVAIYCCFSLAKIAKFSFKSTHVKYIFGYSVPLLPYILSGVVLGQIDRVMINSFFGYEEVGLYSIAYNIGALLTLVVAALNTAFTPKWFDLKKSGNNQKIVELENNILVIVLFFASVLVLFSDELFLLLINDSYHDSMHIVSIVVLAYVFESIFKAYGRVIGYTKKMIYMSLIGILGAIVNVILNYIYIPVYGYEAGALTTLAAFFTMLVTAAGIAKYRLNQPIIPLARFIKPVVGLLLIIFFKYWLGTTGLSYALLLLFKCALFSFLGYSFWKYVNTRTNSSLS